jgi:hypothetical protein
MADNSQYEIIILQLISYIYKCLGKEILSEQNWKTFFLIFHLKKYL